MIGGLSVNLVRGYSNSLSIWHFYSNESHDELTDTLHIPLYWVLIIDFANGVGFVLTMCFLFEFMIAQTPNRMRGIMMGLLFLTRTVSAVPGSQSQLCVLLLSLLLLLMLIVFVILAKYLCKALPPKFPQFK